MAIGYQLIRLVSDQGVIRLSLTFWTLRMCGTNLREAKVSSTFEVPGSDWWDHGAMSAPASRYFHGPMLGEGAYGEVYAMFHRSLGQLQQLRWAGGMRERVRGMKIIWLLGSATSLWLLIAV